MAETTTLQLVLIEDNPGDVRLLREMLDRRRFALESRPSLQAGLQLLEQTEADLVLLDLTLPDSQGLDTLLALRRRLPEAAVVVLTGNSDEQLALEALQAGAQDYLVKGAFDDALLQRTLRYALERHKIESDLVRAKQEWQDTFESLNDLVSVHDTEFNILRCNKEARTFLGKPLADETWPHKCHAYYHGTATPPEHCVLQHMLQTGEEATAEFFEPHLGTYVETRAIPRRNRQGQLIGAIHIVRDISQRKRSEEAERRSHKLSRAMAEATLVFLREGSLSRMARILATRCAEISGADQGFLYDLDPHGQARLLAICESSQPECQNLFQQIGQSLEREESFLLPASHSLMFAPVARRQTILINNLEKHACGEGQFPVQHPTIRSLLATPLFIGDEIVGVLSLTNKPGGFTPLDRVELEAFAQTAALAIQTARTELARQTAIEHLRQAQKMEAVGQLAGGIAHDFNNILTVIQGYSALLMRALQNQPTPLQDARTILKASERAADLVRGLLAFSRRQVIEPRRLDLNSLIAGTEKLLRRLIREDIRIELCPSDGLPPVWADPVQIEQILMNLVVNARDAIVGSGTIRIETAAARLDQDFLRHHAGAVAGTYARLTVQDDGCGMAEEVRQKVFEPFFTTKEPGKGTGLGLATVYGIVKQSGGYIEVQSSPGVGTTFQVYLPETDRQSPRKAARPATDQRPTGPKCILVVEDELPVLKLTTQLLTSCGYQVLAAGSPEQALVLWEQAPAAIDLLLSDVVMPGMSGLELAERLRRSAAGLKILFMTGYAEPMIEAPQQRLSDVHFIQKPFSVESLQAKIQGLFVPDEQRE
jgi:PAS domain S-box-containing protein